MKYYINDCFLTFWFRFIEHNRSLIELGKYDLLREEILNDYQPFSGIMLERYFRLLYSERPRVTEVSRWWDKRGENEIDLIAIEALDHRATIAEVKRNPKKINLSSLKQKAKLIEPHLKDYSISLAALSLNDM